MNFELDPEMLCLRCMEVLPAKGAVCPACSFKNSEYKPKPHHLQPYSILSGRYMLGAVIGEGGFGITYSAFDLSLERHVALKELFILKIVTRQGERVTLVDNSAESMHYYRECRSKFLQEAEALSALMDKSGVVAIYDYFQANGTAYIVMEFLEGDDLLTYLKKNGGKIPYAEAFRLLRPIMKSMIEVHSAAIIHRDISPDNIRYMANREMKLMDFGSARFTTRNSNSQLVMVKPGYAPPEQYSQNYKIGPWMDVYAMSATFYRCITGRTPAPSPERKSDDDIQKPSELGSDIPAKAEEVLLKGMALKPENRYQDMHAFYKALKAASKGVVDPVTGGDGQNPGGVSSEAASYEDLLVYLNSEKSSRTGMYIAVAIGIIIETIIICVLLSGGFR